MTMRACSMVLAAVLLISASGCSYESAYIARPHGGVVTVSKGGPCGPVGCAAPAPCEPMACGPVGCDPCADPCTAGCPPLFGRLLGGIHALLHPYRYYDSGCGDMYVHEWSSDPPDMCDPCNNYGDWIGPQGCGLRFGSSLRRLFGYQSCPDAHMVRRLPILGGIVIACGSRGACGGAVIEDYTMDGCATPGCASCSKGVVMPPSKGTFPAAPRMMPRPSAAPSGSVGPAPRIVPGSPAEAYEFSTDDDLLMPAPAHIEATSAAMPLSSRRVVRPGYRYGSVR